MSDYDLLVIVARELDERRVARLRAYHAGLARDDRASLLLEGDYAPRDALVAEGTTRPAWWFRGGALREPEHMLSADNIADMRESGVVVLGPPPRDILPAVTPEQVRTAVREMLAEEPDLSSELAAARELLGIARSIRALETGAPTSNLAGLRWALAHVDPKWHALLRHAAELRAATAVDPRDARLRDAVRAWRAELGLS